MTALGDLGDRMLVADRVVRRVLGMLAALGRGPGAAAAGDSRSEP
jgi:hypothetical protein